MEKVKVLFLAANPVDTNRLQLDTEIRAITEKIRAAEHRDLLELVSVWAVRADDLLQALNEHKPHIVQFSGHGDPSGNIVLMDDKGTPKLVGADAISSLFRTLKDNIRIVIFNNCYTKTHAQKVIETVNCAVGIDGLIEDIIAITFISSFYRAIGFGRSVQQAFDQGKTALRLEGISEECAPELLVKDGIDPSQERLIFADTTGASVELTINQDFESFTAKDQKKILRAINELLGIDSVKITHIKDGSVLITVDLPHEKVDELLDLVHHGKLKELGIVSARSKDRHVDLRESETESIADSTLISTRSEKYKEFAECLNMRLLELDRNGAWLARRMGVDQGTVSHWLSGKIRPRELENYRRLADILGVKLWVLLQAAIGIPLRPDTSVSSPSKSGPDVIIQPIAGSRSVVVEIKIDSSFDEYPAQELMELLDATLSSLDMSIDEIKITMIKSGSVSISAEFPSERIVDLYALVKSEKLKGHKVIEVCLAGIDLSNHELRNVDLSDADLSHADLTKANLSHANLSNTNLSNANLKQADLRGTNLIGATLNGATLKGVKYDNYTLWVPPTIEEISGTKLRKAWSPNIQQIVEWLLEGDTPKDFQEFTEFIIESSNESDVPILRNLIGGVTNIIELIHKVNKTVII